VNNLERGIIAENEIAREIKDNSNFEIEQNHTWGVDIILSTRMKTIGIEVKSANLFVKNGKNKMRSGKFSFYPNNINKPDFFVFVVNKKDNKKSTYWVAGDVIRNHFKNRKRNSKFTLGIPTLMTRIPKLDFSEVIGFD